MPKTVVHTILIDTKNAAAAENTGRHRAASHNNIGNSQAIGNSICQGFGGSEMTIPVIAASARSAALPSMISRRRGGSRTAAATPIMIGATVTMPKASDAIQCHKLVSIGAEGPTISLYVT